jgi:hypothetical protein
MYKFHKSSSIGFTCIICWIFTYLTIKVFVGYSFGLFVWLPVVLGAISTLIYSYKNQRTRSELRNNAYITLLIFCIGLLSFAWEGVICLIMAAPIGLLFTYLGYLAAYYFTKSKLRSWSISALTVLVLSLPVLMSFEYNTDITDDLRSVKTSIEINASPEIVWKNVVSFPQLSEPNEFIFKTGIAYPINATITGQGIGAVRYCNFSTGSFVEPITIWDKPKLLTFSVKQQPETMKEISLYNIHPSHLHGYWISKKGQFKLIPLKNGHTMLEGTTWYINKIKPGFYWTLWSDFIVHKIHNRVLEHIKVQAEL